MKPFRYFLAAFLCLGSPTLLYAQEGDPQALSDKYGFRDLKFETPLAATKGMVPIKPGATAYKLYTRPTDSKKVGGAQLSSIQYGFYKGKLSSVSLKAKGMSNSLALLKALEAQYGPGEHESATNENYSWLDGRVLMRYSLAARTYDATVTMLSQYMADKQEEDEAKAAKGAASDL